MTWSQARSQNLEKGGGGLFERVRKVQTTLTRIFIVLELVSHGLSENWDEISRKARKFKRFFRPKTRGLQKQKKDLRWNWDWFFCQNRKFKNIFLPKNTSFQKKGLHQNWAWFFCQNRKFKRFFSPKTGGLQKKKGLQRNSTTFSFRIATSTSQLRHPISFGGGAVFNFSQKIRLKSSKNLRFCILHKPIVPPGYATAWS